MVNGDVTLGTTVSNTEQIFLKYFQDVLICYTLLNKYEQISAQLAKSVIQTLALFDQSIDWEFPYYLQDVRDELLDVKITTDETHEAILKMKSGNVKHRGQPAKFRLVSTFSSRDKVMSLMSCQIKFETRQAIFRLALRTNVH